ncbi:MAG TPA: hypothetical protein VM600_10680, partial [Actinomycetota bacterium]|nr:hypothetical protein [Actinomycetota bacterium]
ALVAGAMIAASRNQRTVSHLQEAVSTARIALDRVAREVRHADDIDEVTAGIEALAWYDDDRDGVRDANELVSYVVAAGEFVRGSHAGDVVLARDIAAGSSITVTSAPAGALLRLRLAVDLDVDRPPQPTVVESEVLARNA